MLPNYKLQKGSTLLIEGPASLRLLDGEGFCLGAPLSLKNWAVVKEDRQIPVETFTGATLEIRRGEGTTYREVHETTIPATWREASQIVRQSPGFVVILGDVDSGKSSLCTFLANECFRHGMDVNVIDADIGQADIGPPTTISAARLRNHIFSLQDLEPETSFFVGDTSPSSVPEKLSRGVSLFKDSLTGSAEVILVNTDGWVKGEEASRYKLQLLNDIRPDMVLGISIEAEIDHLLESQRWMTLKLNRSPYAKTRNREERKRARDSGYKRFLQNSKRLELRLDDVKLRRFDSYRQLRIDGDEDLRGVLAGLLDGEERLLSIGRINSIRDGRVVVETRLEDTPRIIELGAVILSSRYEEVGYES